MAARFARTIVDLGTGDGRSVLARATVEPRSLVLGIDASRDRMQAAAIRLQRRGGVPNAGFVVASAEALPSELNGLVDEISVTFPWGSLLRGVLAPDGRVLEGIARLLTPDGCVTILTSVTARDGLTDLPFVLDQRLPARLASTYAAHGLRILTCRPATPAEVAATHSTWAKRLRATRDRQTWRLVIRLSGAR